MEYKIIQVGLAEALGLSKSTDESRHIRYSETLYIDPLEDAVNKQIKLGWEPIGGPVIRHRSDTTSGYSIQAMIKK